MHPRGASAAPTSPSVRGVREPRGVMGQELTPSSQDPRPSAAGPRPCAVLGSWSSRWVWLHTLRVVERLVGRRWELSALIDLVGSARSGRGRGLLLLGDAGIGKTTLAEAVAAEAAGCAVGWGRCPEFEALPYLPWRQALAALGAAAPLAD